MLFRSPMMTVQLSSSNHRFNSRANTTEWWISDYDESGQLLPDDNPHDNYSMNMDFSVDFPPWAGYPNPNNGVPNGIPDEFDFLMRTILRWREYGARRIMLHLPAGHIGGRITGYNQGYPVYGQTTQSMNQFNALPTWKKNYFKGVGGTGWTAWRDFMALHSQGDNPMDVEVYIGGGIGETTGGLGTEATVAGPEGEIHLLQQFTGLNGAGFPQFENFWAEAHTNNHPPYPIDPRAVANGMSMKPNTGIFWQFVHPWWDFCGITRIWLDTASENRPIIAKRWGTLEMAHNPYIVSHNVRLGGEAIPTIDIQGQEEFLDDCAISQMPWFANFEAISLPDNGTSGPRHFKSYVDAKLDRATTEVHILDNTDTMSWEQWKFLRERGYIVGTYNAIGSNPIAAERMKRWYNMGMIQVADFNGDGVVSDPQDRLAAEAAVAWGIAHPDVWPVVFGNGDINDDGFITLDDKIEFLNYWTNVNNRLLNRDYGTPRDSDL